MAVYMSAGHRRRRTVIIVVVAVVVALIAGFVLGRATSSGVDDAVADAKDKGASAVTALSRLPIEYEQKVGGTGGETARKLLDSVDAAEARLEDAFDAAPWLTPAQKRAARAAVASVRADVENDVSPEQFQTGIDDASKAIASTFGIPVSSDLD
jgi:ABC-type Na+ efflux pump permease subunit